MLYSFVLCVEALLSGIVLDGQTQSLRQFQEWAIARPFVVYIMNRILQKTLYFL